MNCKVIAVIISVCLFVSLVANLCLGLLAYTFGSDNAELRLIAEEAENLRNKDTMMLVEMDKRQRELEMRNFELEAQIEQAAKGSGD